MTTDKKVSIIVPIYNGADYIDVFFNCIKRQNYTNLEVILVDDGSLDNSYEKCLKYADSLDCVKAYRKENGGPGSARNYGLNKATGDYLTFFDVDDEFDENIISDNIKEALDSGADVLMWNFVIKVPEKDDIYRPVGGSFGGGREEFFRDFFERTLDNEMFNPPWNKLIKREFLINSKVTFATEFSIYEDILFSYELFRKAEKISVVDKPYYTYIIKDSGSLLTGFHPECFKAILAIYNAAADYIGEFSDNKKLKDRIGTQFIDLTKGFIKQICVSNDLSFSEKRKYLSQIGENELYMDLCPKYDLSCRGKPAKFMMIKKWYRVVVVYYKLLTFLNHALNKSAVNA